MADDQRDPWDGDWPVCNPQCKCGRFVAQPKIIKANGFGEVIEAKTTCSRCGEIDVHVIGWRSDFETPTPVPTNAG